MSNSIRMTTNDFYRKSMNIFGNIIFETYVVGWLEDYENIVKQIKKIQKLQSRYDTSITNIESSPIEGYSVDTIIKDQIAFLKALNELYKMIE